MYRRPESDNSVPASMLTSLLRSSSGKTKEKVNSFESLDSFHFLPWMGFATAPSGPVKLTVSERGTNRFDVVLLVLDILEKSDGMTRGILQPDLAQSNGI